MAVLLINYSDEMPRDVRSDSLGSTVWSEATGADFYMAEGLGLSGKTMGAAERTFKNKDGVVNS